MAKREGVERLIEVLKMTEFVKREAPMHLREEMCSFLGDDGKKYCSMNYTFDGKLTFEYADKVYEIGWEELFRAVESVHKPAETHVITGVEGGVSVTELSGRGRDPENGGE